MLKGFDPTHELLFAEQHTASDLEVRNPLGHKEFANQTLADIQKLCRLADLVEPFADNFSGSWFALRLWSGISYLRFNEFPLDGLQGRNDVLEDDGECGCAVHGKE